MITPSERFRQCDEAGIMSDVQSQEGDVYPDYEIRLAQKELSNQSGTQFEAVALASLRYWERLKNTLK